MKMLVKGMFVEKGVNKKRRKTRRRTRRTTSAIFIE